jgi:GMP synthase (glutamine-hydrolysing)
MAVEIVLTERRALLTDARSANYERLQARVAAASGRPVQVVFYEDVDAHRLREADSIVLSGSTAPWSEHDLAALDRLADAILGSARPVLGICAGMQLQAIFTGGCVGPASSREDGFLPIHVDDRNDLFRDLPDEVVVFQDHSHEVTELGHGFRALASSPACAIQAIGDSERRWWGTQFHPEESRPEYPAGERIIRTFFALAGS